MRRTAAIIISAVVVLVGGLALSAYVYAGGKEDAIAKGVTIGGVDVGGLDSAAARAKLQREVVDPLAEPIVLRWATHKWTLSAREAQISADVDTSVAEAVARSREGSFLSRAIRELRGDRIDAQIQPQLSYSDHAVVRLIDRARKDTEREPRDASLDFGADSVSPVSSASGLEVPASRLHREIRAAILSPSAPRTFKFSMVTVEPKVTTAELAKKYPTVITVDRPNFRLRLFKGLKLVKTYKVAVGQVGLETPAGLYNIQDKQVDPSWHVPQSAWAGKLAGKVIPPGPDNPIKARWMGIFDGAGIHGTSDINSLGSAASHGCVRMAIPDVEDLYDRVDVGTPVYIA